MKKRLLAMGLGLTLLCSTATPIQAAEQAKAEKIDAYLQKLKEADFFNGTVLVAEKGKILLEKGYGYADVATKKENRADTQFLIGSITKQFTATAIMKLQSQKKLSVNDKLAKYYPKLPNANKITIHHLLTHTSGLGEYTVPGYLEKLSQVKSPQEIINFIAKQNIQFQPGAKFAYTNSNYVLLGGIVEKVAKQSLAQYLQTTVFAPLKMKDTSLSYTTEGLPRIATGYNYAEDGFVPVKNETLIGAGAAGAMHSTVSDLFRWSESFKTTKILSKQAQMQMFTPFKDGYAYGWIMEPTLQARLHGGAIDGYLSMEFYAGKDDTTIIILTNRYGSDFDPQTLTQEVYRLLQGETLADPPVYKEVAIDEAQLASYVGEYALTATSKIVITADKGALYLQITGQPRFRIHKNEDDTFYIRSFNQTFTFTNIKDGKYTTLIANGYPAKRIQ